MEPVQIGHPERYFLDAKVIAQDKIFPGCLCLLLKGSDLKLQFLDFVVDAEQVVFRLFQLTDCIIFSVAETGDPCRFLENITAVGVFIRKDICDPSLSDVGIPVSSEAGIHQKGVYVFQSDRFPVNGVFTLAVPVIPPG